MIKLLKKSLTIILSISLLILLSSYNINIIENKSIKKEIKEKSTYNDPLLKAIIYLESTNNKYKYNAKENAVGIIQIRPIMVKEVNNLLGYEKFTLEDRWDSLKSIEMYKIYQHFKNPNYDAETAARIWNGGEKGMKKKATIKYWEDILEIIEKGEKNGNSNSKTIN